ncbi:oligosaccharide flippase family protein [Spirosoma sp. RP8]|uniref:Oligosaccharide flippase family protein n=1 Tax=Spirosoma liriopis TaxID=2937440 RepID=A0ABT0HNL0_9BACT|nr:oligosaccharide flippase family protein [Spirosoma liriopis]MCK8493755.1 oligosaccharide flippase family protein [Spirosoma liriopis]
MSIKKNYFYNNILLITQYIVPLIVFPYVSRVLGIEKIGILNWIDNTINYFIIISTLGLTLTGVREVSKVKNDKVELSKVFSELIILHTVITLMIVIIYMIVLLNNDKFIENKNIFFIGITKIVFNIFLIEWFFKGLEDFKYITNRSIAIKLIYVILILIFVKNENDYTVYYIITCLTYVVNSVVNIVYAKKYILFQLNNINIKRHFRSYTTIGLYIVLTSMYTTFNVTFLGFVSTEASVGSYTTALKLYSIILGLFSALNSVLIPKLSYLITEREDSLFKDLINKSMNFIITMSFPIIFCGIALAPQIINIIAGPGFERSIVCFKVILPLIFIVGIAQILSNQILIPINKDKQLAYISFIGAFIGVTLNILLVRVYKEIGTALVVVVSEICVTVMLYYLCYQYTKIKLPFVQIIYNIILSIPYFLIAYLVKSAFIDALYVLIISIVLSLIYFLLIQVYIIKNKIIISQITSISSKTFA